MSFTEQKIRRRISFIRTALGLGRKGFYTPYNYVSGVEQNTPPYTVIADHLETLRPTFKNFILEMANQEEYFLASNIGFPIPDWDSKWISPLDAAALQTMIALYKPKRIMEIGSGNSTYHMLRAIVDHKLETHVTCIDPAPRIEVGDLPISLERRVLSKDDIEIAAGLEAADVLFVDSSHIMQEGFDVDLIFNRIFPRLKSGVIVHIHDIFLPYGYPKDWEGHRLNEQNALIGWLVSGYFETLFASHFAYRDMQDDLNAICKKRPLVTPRNGGAYWMRKS